MAAAGQEKGRGSLQSPVVGVAIDMTKLLSWGANTHGQLGQSHTKDQFLPQSSAPGTADLQHITGGGGHSLVLTSEGSLLACGSNASGELGTGGGAVVTCFTVVPFSSPVLVRQVAAGWDFSLAVTENGTIYSWGNNKFCQLGRVTEEKTSMQPEVIQDGLPPGIRGVSVAAGLRHALLLSEDGTVHTWGQNRRGQVGDVVGSDGKQLGIVPYPLKLAVPEDVMPVQIAAGAYHSGFRAGCGAVYMWGCNKYGQTSHHPDSNTRITDPYCIAISVFGGRQVRHIACGWTHSLAVTDSGEVYSWGRADYGQLGRPCDQSFDHTPKPVEKLGKAHTVACGSEHNLAITDDGKLWSWGWNEHGMCGTGDDKDVHLPVQVASQTRHVMTIGCGAGHSMALVKDDDWQPQLNG